MTPGNDILARSAVTVLITTYTMDDRAAVVGVFFRALRLGRALRRRGHRVVIANRGTIPEDPKVEAALRAGVEIRTNGWDTAHDERDARTFYAAAEPDVVVVGEGPFDTLEPSFAAATSLGVPVVLLDQYYQDWLVKTRDGVDRFLLYGLVSLLRPDELDDLDDRVVLMPPFIDDLTPIQQLVGPGTDLERPRLTVLGFDRGVHDRGIALAARLDPRPFVLVVGQAPAASRETLAKHGLVHEGVALGRVDDADLFGALAASQAVILANGYMQILEALALATPAICLGRGVGLEGWTVHDGLRPYVSIEEDEETQLARLRDWLAETPFTADSSARLAEERRGATVCAAAIEAVLAERSCEAIR